MIEIVIPKKRILVLIDGFNLYHSIADNKDHPELRKYKWLNLRKLVEPFVFRNKEEITRIVYFSAYAYWSREKVLRHQTYVSALRTISVEPIISPFKLVERECQICKKKYKTHEEKQTDVQIAINLFQEAIEDSYDKAIIISGDSDLIPAIKAVKSKFPLKEIKILFPPRRRMVELTTVCDSSAKIKEKHLAAAQFPDTIRLGENARLDKPSKWTEV
ncbi:NYN domain-containing protein [Candidatus Omnitrophota bacterium]